MANVKVALLRYCCLESGWRRLRVIPFRKGRGWGEELKVPKGKTILKTGGYQLRWYEGKREHFEDAGPDLQEAIIARDYRISVLQAESAAATVGRKLAPETPNSGTLPDDTRLRLTDARDRFIEKKKLVDLDAETIMQYENLIQQFLDLSKKKFADEIEELDLLRFCDALRKRGCQERTVVNYYSAIATFLLSCGIDHKALVARQHRPKSEDPDPREYSPEDMKKFLGACISERERLVFEMYLKTGGREQEIAFLEWTDCDLSQGSIIIKKEKRLALMVKGFLKNYRYRSKTRRTREVPLVPELLSQLQAWRKKNPNTRFVFGTKADLPDSHFLRAVKRTARHAGLNCGKCKNCVEKNECENWDLKTFRSTFATWSLRRGVDIRTVQDLMGHTEIEMTARYLAPLKGEEAQRALTGVFSGISTVAGEMSPSL